MCNTRLHAETGETPIARFLAGGPPRAADPGLLQEAFRWSAQRVVTRTATVSLAGNRYEVDPGVVGKRVELRYDPENMASLSVYLDGRPAGMATPFVLGHHVHPAVPQAARAEPQPTGIDYLGLCSRPTMPPPLSRLPTGSWTHSHRSRQHEQQSTLDHSFRFHPHPFYQGHRRP
jgi:hypothetical protein